MAFRKREEGAAETAESLSSSQSRYCGASLSHSHINAPCSRIYNGRLHHVFL